MNYVESFNLLGVEAKQIPSIVGEGAPTPSTEGAVGCFYMDTLTGDVYKCTAVEGDVYTWETIIEIAQEPGVSETAVMSQKAVTDLHDNLFEYVVAGNHLDITTQKTGMLHTNGQIYTGAAYDYYYYYEQYIPVLSGDELSLQYTKKRSGERAWSATDTNIYTRMKFSRVVAYDKEKNLLTDRSSIDTEPIYTWIVPDGVAFVRITLQKSFFDLVTDVALVKNVTEIAPYFEYGDFNAKFKTAYLPDWLGISAALKLPTQYELVVGDTFELFYKGIINAVNTDLFHIEIECAKGNPFKKRFIFTPAAVDVGTIPMTIKLYDLHHNLLDTKSLNLVVRAKATSPTAEKTVLYVTDSLGANGYVADEFNRRLTGNGGNPTADNMENISFIGTCESIDHKVKYEGYGGWQFGTYNIENKSDKYMWVTTAHDKTVDDQHSTYKDSNNTLWKLETIETNRLKFIRVSGSGTLAASGSLVWVADGINHSNITYTASEQASGNPFWNESTSRVDFANYVTKQGKTTLDFVYVLLGWNNHPLVVDSYKSTVNTFIDNVLSEYPNCKIVLLGLQIPSQDGVALNYGANSAYSNYYDLVNHVWKLNELYAEIATEYDNVSFVNICGQFDTENNMLSGSRNVNVRNSTKETYQTNGVHPAQSGYYQIADACYRDFVHKLQA